MIIIIFYWGVWRVNTSTISVRPSLDRKGNSSFSSILVSRSSTVIKIVIDDRRWVYRLITIIFPFIRNWNHTATLWRNINRNIVPHSTDEGEKISWLEEHHPEYTRGAKHNSVLRSVAIYMCYLYCSIEVAGACRSRRTESGQNPSLFITIDIVTLPFPWGFSSGAAHSLSLYTTHCLLHNVQYTIVCINVQTAQPQTHTTNHQRGKLKAWDYLLLKFFRPTYVGLLRDRLWRPGHTADVTQRTIKHTRKKIVTESTKTWGTTDDDEKKKPKHQNNCNARLYFFKIFTWICDPHE